MTNETRIMAFPTLDAGAPLRLQVLQLNGNYWKAGGDWAMSDGSITCGNASELVLRKNGHEIELIRRARAPDFAAPPSAISGAPADMGKNVGIVVGDKPMPLPAAKFAEHLDDLVANYCALNRHKDDDTLDRELLRALAAKIGAITEVAEARDEREFRHDMPGEDQ